jgi:putative transposase
MRYVERNPLRAGLVERAEEWPWGSLAWRSSAGAARLLEPPPVALPHDWRAWVNAPQTPEELRDLRRCVNQQVPFGSAEWLTAQATGPNRRFPPRPRGRPRKADPADLCPPLTSPEIR